MQVSLMPTVGTNRPAGISQVLLLPDLGQLLQPSAAGLARHEQRVAQREDKLREKDTENQEAAADAAQAPRSSDVLRQAEREMAPGSQALRREQMRAEAQASANQEPRGFRQVLADATGRGASERGAAPTPESAAVTPAQDSDPAQPSSSAAEPTRTPIEDKPTQATATTARPEPVAAQPAAVEAMSRLAAFAALASPAASRPVAVEAAAAASSPGAKVSAAPAVSAGTTGATTAGSTPRPAAPPLAAIEPEQLTDVPRKGAPASAPTADAEETGNSDANIQRILRLIQTRIGKDRSVATLRLDPPELGTIRLRLDLRAQHLSIAIETQTPAARRLLEQQLDTLRHNLEVSGIQLERVEMRTPAMTNDPPDGGTGSQPDVPGRDPGRSGQRDPGTAGSGSHPGTESPTADTADGGRGAARMMGPAAESLVNVLA
jgi:flagellar hook-length control protein FliK